MPSKTKRAASRPAPVTTSTDSDKGRSESPGVGPGAARSRRRSIVEEVMSEPCIYGGLLASRGEVYADLAEQRGPNGERISDLMIDRLTWTPKSATPEQAARLTECGLTLKRIRAMEKVAGGGA